MSVHNRTVASQILSAQVFKYIINGLAATGIHFSVLVFCLEVLHWQTAGFANLVASIFGITASFIGSRYFVFSGSNVTARAQIVRFIVLYAMLAAMHGFVMYLWADVAKLNYVVGFVIATGLQVLSSYFGNKLVVFKV